MNTNEKLRPANAKQIAVELEKLRAVFGYEAGSWQTASALYFDALADMPADLLAEAVAASIRTAGPEDRFPKPGALRALVAARLEYRRSEARRERRGRGEEAWPRWLAEIWGPEPQGPIDRNQMLALYCRQEEESCKRLDEVRRIMDQMGLTADQAWRVWAGKQPGSAISDLQSLKQVQQALGISAKAAAWQDDEAVKRDAAKLALGS